MKSAFTPYGRDIYLSLPLPLSLSAYVWRCSPTLQGCGMQAAGCNAGMLNHDAGLKNASSLQTTQARAAANTLPRHTTCKAVLLTTPQRNSRQRALKLLEESEVRVRQVIRQRVWRQQDARKHAPVDIQDHRRRPRWSPPGAGLAATGAGGCAVRRRLAVFLGLAMRGAEPAAAVAAKTYDAPSLQPCHGRISSDALHCSRSAAKSPTQRTSMCADGFPEQQMSVAQTRDSTCRAAALDAAACVLLLPLPHCSARRRGALPWPRRRLRGS